MHMYMGGTHYIIQETSIILVIFFFNLPNRQIKVFAKFPRYMVMVHTFIELSSGGCILRSLEPFIKP